LLDAIDVIDAAIAEIDGQMPEKESAHAEDGQPLLH
jgi:hypothetical protein